MNKIIILIILEVIEANIQRGSTLKELILYNYSIYRHNIFIYFFYNFTFIYALLMLFMIDINNFWLNLIVILKFLDMSFKLFLFQKIDKNGESALKEFVPLDVKLTLPLKYSNTLIYSTLLLFAIS